jgi:hypothetical protein
MNTGILAACLPTLRPLFASLLETANAFSRSGIRPEHDNTISCKKTTSSLLLYLLVQLSENIAMVCPSWLLEDELQDQKMGAQYMDEEAYHRYRSWSRA